MGKKVSVIMSVYNCEKTIAQAIESIICQTFDDWELIICDDGSTDKSYEIAEKYRSDNKDKIILMTNESNIGLNKSLNRCLMAAKGIYIARMDGDDISAPTRFQEEVDFLDNNPEYAIVSTQMVYFNEEGAFKTSNNHGEPLKSSFAKGTPFCHAPCMVRRDAYIAVDGYTEDNKRLRVEDWDLWIKMYEKGFRGYNIPKPLYWMRDDRNALKRRKFKYRLNEARVSISAVKKLRLPKINYIYALRPIIVGVLPRCVYTFLHKK